MNAQNNQTNKIKPKSIPVTILTGFLGSGKTTLLKYILEQNHGFKIAIIENEFGSENIDQELIYQHTSEHIIQMNNGCVCCTIRSDLQQALVQLQTDQAAGTYDFDYVIIETTGLAEPSPIAQTFFLDAVIAKAYRLDGVISLVDAKHTLKHAEQHQEIQKQIGFADRLLISKTDLVNEQELSVLQRYLREVNIKAPIKNIEFGVVDLSDIFNLKAFNLDDALEFDRDFLIEAQNHHHHKNAQTPKNSETPKNKIINIVHQDVHQHNHEHQHDHNCDDHCGHDHSHDHEHHHHHEHQSPAFTAPSIQSFAYLSKKPFDYAKLEKFFGQILNLYSENLLRYKGVLHIKNVKEKLIIQGVHEIFAAQNGKKWTQAKPESKMVFIGIDLPKDILQKGLDLCLA